jgi:hypothetical protein
VDYHQAQQQRDLQGRWRTSLQTAKVRQFLSPVFHARGFVTRNVAGINTNRTPFAPALSRRVWLQAFTLVQYPG